MKTMTTTASLAGLEVQPVALLIPPSPDVVLGLALARLIGPVST